MVRTIVNGADIQDYQNMGMSTELRAINKYLKIQNLNFIHNLLRDLGWKENPGLRKLNEEKSY